MNPCYLCGSTSNAQRRGIVRDAPELRVLQCNDCGLVFLSSFEHIQDCHYEHSGMHGDELPEITAWLLESESDDVRRINFLKPKLVGKRLLDFGCGPGGFLDKARSVAVRVTGVEPALRLQNYFRSEGLQVFPSIGEVLASGLKFDLITAFHVVEHLPNSRLVIIQLAGLLNPGDELIIEVPNSEDALLTLFKCEPFMSFTYWSQHLFLFNQRTLSKLVEQEGLNILWIKQLQRYTLFNHLYWLACGKPGGHKKWAFIDSLSLQESYSSQLAALGMCDTLLAGITAE